MISFSSSFGSSSVVFDGTSMYVIPSCEFDSENEELVKTFKSFEAAEEFCDEQSELI